MVNCPPGISELEFRALAEQRRRENFLAAYRLPGMWRIRADVHKRGADYLYELAYAASERQHARDLAEPLVEGSCSKELEGDELRDFHDQRLLAEYLLLIGYALECLFKGYLLAMIPELLVKEKRLDNLLKTHDLAQLSHDCAIALSLEEKTLLNLITRHIYWGKYTAPLSVSDMPSWVDPDDQETMSLAVSNAFHKRRVQVLADGVYARASSLLESEQRRRRDQRAG